MNTRPLLTAALALLLGACSTSTPIGEVPTAGTTGNPMMGAGGTSATAGAPGQAWVPSPGQWPDDQPFTNPSGIAADWVGYFEDYSLHYTGSDVVKLHFGGGQGTGTLTVVRGTGTPPPPPTDAFQAWPLAIVDENGNPGPGTSYPYVPIDGYAYTGHAVTWQGSRLRFSLIEGNPWTVWCSLQTSYKHPVDSYSCNAGTSANFTPGQGGRCKFVENPSWPCTANHIQMCLHVCSCNATGCGPSGNPAFSYDLAFFADRAEGSSGGYRVRLTPVAP